MDPSQLAFQISLNAMRRKFLFQMPSPMFHVAASCKITIARLLVAVKRLAYRWLYVWVLAILPLLARAHCLQLGVAPLLEPPAAACSVTTTVLLERIW